MWPPLCAQMNGHLPAESRISPATWLGLRHRRWRESSCNGSRFPRRSSSAERSRSSTIFCCGGPSGTCRRLRKSGAGDAVCTSWHSRGGSATRSSGLAHSSVLILKVAMRSFALRLPALLLASFVAQTCVAQSAGTTEPLFRVTVRVEVVDAQVISKKTKHAVNALKREDFVVYEDNVQQEITSFSQDQLPLSVVILFDLTDSVRPVLR